MPASVARGKGRISITQWLPWVAGLAIVFLLLAIGREIVRRYAIEQEKQGLERSNVSLQEKNAALTQLLQYAQTQTYAEEQARLRFGLGKAGEHLAIISDQAPGAPTALPLGTSDGHQPSAALNQKNWQRWWAYFFKP